MQNNEISPSTKYWYDWIKKNPDRAKRISYKYLINKNKTKVWEKGNLSGYITTSQLQKEGYRQLSIYTNEYDYVTRVIVHSCDGKIDVSKKIENKIASLV